MDLLVCLAERAEHTVSKDELLTLVWRDAYLRDGVIAKTVSALRKALGDDARDPTYIVTVPRRGYRWIAPVQREGQDVGASEARGPDPRDGGSARDSLAAAAPGEAAGLDPASGLDPSVIVDSVGAGSGTRRRPGGEVSLRVLLGAGAISALLVFWAWLAMGEKVRPGSGAPSLDSMPAITTLSVEPFANASPEGQYAYLATALFGEVVAELARLDNPQVILLPEDRSVYDVLSLTRRPRAEARLRGRVETDGRRLVVSLRLVRPENGRLLWAETFDRPLESAFEVKQDLARQVVARLDQELDELERERLFQTHRVDPLAYQKFLQARWLWHQRGREDLVRSKDLFLEATTLDPTFAEGFAGLALSFVSLGTYGLIPIDEAHARIDAAARRALELNPRTPEAHTALGWVELDRHWRLEEAIAEYRRAVELAPGPTSARQMLAESLSFAGRHSQALEVINEALVLEPYSALLHSVRGVILNAASCPRAALDSLDRAVLFGPRFSWVHRYRSYALARLGRHSEAAEARLESTWSSGHPDGPPEELAAEVAQDGLSAFWRWQEARLESASVSSETFSGPAVLLAEAHAGLGQRQQALESLERAAERRGEYFLHLLRSSAFDALHDDPDFSQLIDDLGVASAVPTAGPCQVDPVPTR
ncbi:MAG: winged helix-turn-helix domain-containing protein [Thermoanaerobaculia bacterium]|nr:winged helix-turn-helix domain-containing protein [Thermoanaerobaculia bacterium]